MIIWKSLATFLLLFISLISNAQYDPIKKCIIDASGQCISNALITAVPYLRHSPDARSSAMGDVGVALKPDPNSLHFNPSTWAFSEQKSSLSFTYLPWIQNFNLNDNYLISLSGFRKLSQYQTLGGGIRFNSSKEIQSSVATGILGVLKPREFDISAAYALKINEKLSVSLTGRYISSNLATGLVISGQDVSTGTSIAGDIGLNYRAKTTLKGFDAEWSYGLSISNIGSKMKYIKTNEFSQVIPTNLALGSALTIDYDKNNSLTFALDFNKLLVPTPRYDVINYMTGVPVFRDRTLLAGMAHSFFDAQGGTKEELQELGLNIGMEYWYDQQFAARAGYHYEHSLKGNLKYFTFGIGIKLNNFCVSLSHLVPTIKNQSALDNTLRLSLLYDVKS